MQALVRMPPKQHEQMKLGEKKVKKDENKRASAKPKSAT
jgi:hypothetical protein